MDKLIEEYIKRMNIDDVSNFSKKYGIYLSKEELNIVYNYIINDWRTIIHGNPRSILDELKEKINNESYNKIEQLYIHFKNRYL